MALTWQISLLTFSVITFKGYENVYSIFKIQYFFNADIQLVVYFDFQVFSNVNSNLRVLNYVGIMSPFENIIKCFKPSF